MQVSISYERPADITQKIAEYYAVIDHYPLFKQADLACRVKLANYFWPLSEPVAINDYSDRLKFHLETSLKPKLIEDLERIKNEWRFATDRHCETERHYVNERQRANSLEVQNSSPFNFNGPFEKLFTNEANLPETLLKSIDPSTEHSSEPELYQQYRDIYTFLAGTGLTGIQSWYDFQDFQRQFFKNGHGGQIENVNFTPGKLFHGNGNFHEILISGEIPACVAFTRLPHLYAMNPYNSTIHKYPALFIINTAVFNRLLESNITSLRCSHGYLYPTSIQPITLNDVEEIWIGEITAEKITTLPENTTINKEFSELHNRNVIKIIPGLEDHNSVNEPSYAIYNRMKDLHLFKNIPLLKTS